VQLVLCNLRWGWGDLGGRGEVAAKRQRGGGSSVQAERGEGGGQPLLYYCGVREGSTG